MNTPCAELLYSGVMEAMCETKSQPISDGVQLDNSNVLCLDVCSGTGTIGICCAKNGMGHVIGVELCQAAVKDAIDNASMNGLRLFTHSRDSVQSDLQSRTCDVNSDVKDGSNMYECGFICSRAETVMESLIGGKKHCGGGVDLKLFQDMARGKKVLAVVDPPRGKRPSDIMTISYAV